LSPRARGLAAAALVALPVLVGLGYSAAVAFDVAGIGAAGWSSGRIARVLGESTVWRSVSWTALTAAAATLVAAAAAVVVAVSFRSTDPGARLARALAVAPLPIPHLVAAAGGVLILGQSGLLARLAAAAGLIGTPAEMPALIYDPRGVGLVLTLAWKEFPFLALVAFSLLAGRGQSLEEAARTLGAGSGETFRRVTWPVLWRGLLPATVAVFAFAAGSYETAVLLAPSDPLPLSVLTLERYHDPSLAARGDAFVLVLLALVVAGIAVALHEWARSRAEPVDG
jgi:putative spermidine/putrescine transport system permease protein